MNDLKTIATRIAATYDALRDSAVSEFGDPSAVAVAENDVVRRELIGSWASRSMEAHVYAAELGLAEPFDFADALEFLAEGGAGEGDAWTVRYYATSGGELVEETPGIGEVTVYTPSAAGIAEVTAA
jgi:hypothetical protein